ncbi:FadR family transcriptional regulator, partial [Desulfovibrio sp. OttesenSCG-928-O18]|nr:FadR family transcriptional regulator [Desulfovibrio sp. OttesenSCG-928-O18]
MPENLPPSQPPTQPEKKGTLRDMVIEQIRELIRTEKLQHGQRLPAERVLSQTFAVSRHLVREALRVLEQQNVVVSRIGSGSYVQDPDAVLNGVLNDDTIRSRSNLLEIMEFRRTLEPRIAFLAAGRITSEARGELQKILEAMHTATRQSDLPTWHELDAAFHSRLALMSGNFLYEKTVTLLHHAMVTFSDPASPLLPAQMRSSYSDHLAIAKAVAAGNGKRAAAAMESHIVAIVRGAL